MDTARDIITESLLDLGVLADGETPTAIQAAGALKKLNGMLELWSLDNLLVYGMTENVLPLVSNQGIYTIGAGGDLDIPRPNNIIAVAIRDMSQPLNSRFDFPIRIYNNEEWAEVTLKGMTALWPAYGVYFDYQFPYINAYTNPIPSSSQYSLVIYTSGILSNLTLDQVLQFPPGYRTLIVSNLSIELSGTYQVEVPASVQLAATKSQKLISNKNIQINELETPHRGYYNIYTDRMQ